MLSFHTPLHCWLLRCGTLAVLALAACDDGEALESDDPESDEGESASEQRDSGKRDAGKRDAESGSSSNRDAGARADANADSPSGRDDGGESGRPPARDAGTTARDAAAASDAQAPSDGDPELEALRQLCVDHINMYRETLGLPGLMRARDQETCSDQGAKLDGDSRRAHGSAGMCRGLGAQDTCPGWPVGPRTGNNTLADALTRCLDQMWAEGEPTVSRMACIQDLEGCFLDHGHYLNMSDPNSGRVACGFYQMANGAWWMNQNFGR